MKYSFFIDGFNFYHSLHDNKLYHKYKWIDYYKLASLFIKKTDTISGVYWFTALANWNPEKRQKHQLLIRASELSNVQIIYGEFKRKDKYCTLCKRYFISREEKMTDVNIAIYLFDMAYHDTYDKAIIVSADSDLIPTIKAVHKNFPTKEIGILLPICRRSESLKNEADFHMKIKEKHLKSSLFPEEIHIENNQILKCPDSWK
ncbi:MAG: NYN domain-containing protein [Candidatus Nanoarchaeia archaeon]|nr:NYN domain-containing protein [Candidatus Nanoarchaeia archaeon]